MESPQIGMRKEGGKMIKGGGDRMMDWILWLCNMAFESSVVPEEGRLAVIVQLYKGKEERTECKNYRSISLLSLVRKIYTGILLDRVRRVTGSSVDD